VNYLAHIYLSGSTPEVQVGGLLGDFVKGPLKGELPTLIEQGVALHREIDSATDRHPQFREILSSLPKPWRRFGGVLIDVHFDHLLAQRWAEFQPGELGQFCARFYAHLESQWQHLPAGARRFCEIAPQVQWLESYRDAHNIPRMLDNVGKRLRRPVALGEGWHRLLENSEALDACFDTLMAEHRERACAFLEQVSRPAPDNHPD
jgi:acyl carrier protein phosphodiesterase